MAQEFVVDKLFLLGKCDGGDLWWWWCSHTWIPTGLWKSLSNFILDNGNLEITALSFEQAIT